MLYKLGAMLQHTSQKSLKHLAQEARISKCSAATAMKLLKTSVAQSNSHSFLQPHDQASRIHFGNWFCSLFIMVTMTYVSSQNDRYWSSVNPHSIHEVKFNLFKWYRECMPVQKHHFQYLL
jgi:hypothetical protein